MLVQQTELNDLRTLEFDFSSLLILIDNKKYQVQLFICLYTLSCFGLFLLFV